MLERKGMTKIVAAKDAGVELMRILGCMIVIACHCVVQYKFNDEYNFPNTFFACLWADGVAVFWLIAGFFVFRNSNAMKKLKNFSIKRLLPALAVGMGLFYLYDWATSDVSFSESISHTGQEYLELLTGLLKLQSPFPKSGHFWYVFIYVLVLLAFPALKGFYDWMIGSVKREVAFLAVTFVAITVNDIFLNETFSFSNLSINALVPACIFILWGAVLYRHKEIFLKPMMSLGGLVGFVSINLLRTSVVVERNDGHQLFWFTAFGLIASVCLFIFCINVVKHINKNIIGKIFCYIASYTFVIYLIHYGVKDVITYLDIKDKIKIAFPLSEPLNVFIYNVLMMLLVFIASLALAMVFRYVKMGIVVLWKKCISRILP